MTIKTPAESAQELRQRAEERLRQLEAPSLQHPSPEETERLLHELRVHQIEIEMQNDELRRKQDELEALRERYFSLYDLAPIGYLTFSANGLIQEANLIATTLLGVDRIFLLKMPFSKFIAPEDQDIYFQHRKQLIDVGETPTWDMRLVRADGSMFWAQFSALTLNNGEHRITFNDISERKLTESELKDSYELLEQRVMARTTELSDVADKLTHEIEERKLVEQALQHSEQYYHNVLQTSQEGYWVIDMHGHIIEVNNAYCNIIGYSREELLGMSIADVEVLENSAEIDMRIQQAIIHSSLRFDSQHRRKDGQIVDLEISVNYISHEDRIFSFLRNITERKQAEISIKESNEKLESKVAERTSALEQSNERVKRASFDLIWAEERERERIAGELHDQVGQSLLLAKMKLDRLVEGLSSDQMNTYAAEALSLIELSINDIRSLTFRMRPPILDTSGIETALKWLCSSLSKDYDLQIDYEGDCSSIQLSAESRYSLYQAVRELLINVVKHAQTARAQLTANIENGHLLVHIVDNGVGFDCSDSILKHMSEGYGLFNVRLRIEQIGGRFAVDSAPGRGTSVILSVPLTE